MASPYGDPEYTGLEASGHAVDRLLNYLAVHKDLSCDVRVNGCTVWLTLSHRETGEHIRGCSSKVFGNAVDFLVNGKFDK